MAVDAIDLDQVPSSATGHIIVAGPAAAIGLGMVSNAGCRIVMYVSHRSFVTTPRSHGKSHALVGAVCCLLWVPHLPTLGSSISAAMLGLVLLVTPGHAFEIKGNPNFPYEEIYPFGTNIHSCTDKLYEQDSHGQYVYRGISITYSATIKPDEGTMLLSGIDVFGAEFRPSQAVTYYRIRDNGDTSIMVEHSKSDSKNDSSSKLNVVVRQSTSPGITDLLAEENYLTLLLQERSANSILSEVERIEKTYDDISLYVLVPGMQVLRRWSGLRPVRVELAVDVNDPEDAVRQMIEMSSSGLRAAEAMKRGRRMERMCN
ncbi:MAG: hypothetical protein KDK89_14650 [Alphaproteobacteria bacterium]|nr:hypothetical protein [Alphaproteobacteria bacterium]